MNIHVFINNVELNIACYKYLVCNLKPNSIYELLLGEYSYESFVAHISNKSINKILMKIRHQTMFADVYYRTTLWVKNTR